MRLLTGGLVVALLLGGVAACGLPEDGSSTTLDAGSVPYDLLRPAPQDSSSPAPMEVTSTPHVYLLNAADQLVPVRAPTSSRGLLPVEEELLGRLASGPNEQERAHGLATALGPDVSLRVVSLTGGLATIEVGAGSHDPSADRLPLAVGQVVLTATSVVGVDSVQLTRGGRVIEVPLPGGALTSDPLTPAGYLPLVVRTGRGTGKVNPAPTQTTPTGWATG